MLLAGEPWLRLSQAERDAAYDNTRAVANSAAQLTEFEARSASLVELQSGALLDVPYGPAQRQRLDYFPSRQPRAGAGTLLFIHGGYWQMRHKNTFRFLAEGALEQGLSAALIGYTLAPEASMSHIVSEVRDGIAAVRQQALSLGGSGRILLCGWSAGAHLAAMTLDSEGVVAGLGISGIYELAPLAHTYFNAALQLTADDVAGLSPLRRPRVPTPWVTAWGLAELPELQAQSMAWTRHREPGGLDLTLSVPGADHFSVLETLAAANGVLLRALMRQALR